MRDVPGENGHSTIIQRSLHEDPLHSEEGDCRMDHGVQGHWAIVDDPVGIDCGRSVHREFPRQVRHVKGGAGKPGMRVNDVQIARRSVPMPEQSQIDAKALVVGSRRFDLCCGEDVGGRTAELVVNTVQYVIKALI